MPEAPLAVPLAEKLLQVDDALRRSGIPYAFGGAIALAYHVRQPRGTVDLDVNLAAPASDARAVLDLLPETAWDDDTIARLDQEGWVRVWLDGDVALDLFVPQHAFHTELQEAVEQGPFGGRTIPVVSATHLTVLKAMFNRTKDWADIEAMLAAGGVDTDAALSWTAELLGDDGPGHRHLIDLVATT